MLITGTIMATGGTIMATGGTIMTTGGTIMTTGGTKGTNIIMRDINIKILTMMKDMIPKDIAMIMNISMKIRTITYKINKLIKKKRECNNLTSMMTIVIINWIHNKKNLILILYKFKIKIMNRFKIKKVLILIKI